MSDGSRAIQSVHLVEAFHTFQGEGFHAGRRALFLRMPFCNLECSWCDTKFDKFTPWTLDALMGLVKQEPSTNFAVVTGGEPALHKHTPGLVKWLKDLGFYVAVETNGTVAIPSAARFDFVTVSPKRFAKEKGLDPYYVNPVTFQLASEFKYVVDLAFDFSVLERHRGDDMRRLSLSPEWDNRAALLPVIYDYIKENPQWRLSIQQHKVLGLR